MFKVALSGATINPAASVSPHQVGGLRDCDLETVPSRGYARA